MFETILADVYVISANGKYSNPDYATLTWIVEANDGERPISLVITNETDSSKRLLKGYDPAEWNYNVKYISDGELSIEI